MTMDNGRQQTRVLVKCFNECVCRHRCWQRASSWQYSHNFEQKQENEEDSSENNNNQDIGIRE